MEQERGFQMHVNVELQFEKPKNIYKITIHSLDL